MMITQNNSVLICSDLSLEADEQSSITSAEASDLLRLLAKNGLLLICHPSIDMIRPHEPQPQHFVH